MRIPGPDEHPHGLGSSLEHRGDTHNSSTEEDSWTSSETVGDVGCERVCCESANTLVPREKKKISRRKERTLNSRNLNGIKQSKLAASGVIEVIRPRVQRL